MQSGYYYPNQGGFDQFPGLQAVHDAVRGPGATPSNPNTTGVSGYTYGSVQRNAQKQQQSQQLQYPPQPQSQQPQHQPLQHQHELQQPVQQPQAQQHTPQGIQQTSQDNASVNTGQSKKRKKSADRNGNNNAGQNTERNGGQDTGRDADQDSEQRTKGVQLIMPPVVGSQLHYANKHVKYRPFPPDVMAVREKLFKMEEPFLLDSQAIADYWTHMSNVWMRSTRPSLEPNGTVVEVWECRIRRRVERKGQLYTKSTSTGVRNRPNKDSLLGEADACTPRIRVVSYTKHAENPKEPCGLPGFLDCQCIPEWVYFERTVVTKNKDLQHTHDLDMCDRYKRTNALMYCCKLKVEERYQYPAVMRWMKEKYGHISREVEYIQKQDVANVSRFWKQAHRGEEMRSQVVDETPADKRRKDCMDAIDSNSVDRLRKALSEVCKQIPEAMDIAMPFLDLSQVGDETPAEIPSGEGIKIPFPGLPHKKMLLFEPSGLPLAPTPTSQAPQPPFAAGPSTSQGAPPANMVRTAPLPTHGLPLQSSYSKLATPSSVPGPTSAHAIRSALPDVRQAHMTDPESTHRAFIEASSAIPPNAPAPYAASAQSSKVAIPPLSRSRSSGQSWPPPSIAHPVANGTPRTGPAPAPFMQARPAWAQPVVPQKRALETSPETARKSAQATPNQSRSERPSLVDEISSQLRKELAA